MKLPWVSSAQYHELVTNHQAVQDRLRIAESQNGYLREELDRARRDATVGREIVADWLALQVTGRKIFGTGPDLPVDAPDAELIDQMSQRSAGATARSRALQAEKDFLEQYQQKAAEAAQQIAAVRAAKGLG